ncbi:anthranilate synthase component II [Halocatena pleomorpha]|uniref:Anthranilate synthase component II n=1 Tax=Halocatena pleomorpha TaxID=1785090 RepID=A0A3P3RDU1_9EURY|nr:aminodeoxychorismate/anthranilate synthase component II [Halocatena pleomorpha]RRJ30890.1 aminodeoxychorismate/anthranilate synthase component II [Halocatena pleomorpha]
MTVLVIDNYDSFVYNLVQYVGASLTASDLDDRNGKPVVVRRNDDIDVAGIRAIDPDGVIVSPGPGAPAEAGVSMAVFSELSYPALGVCLGHQALCAAAGVSVGHAPAVVHGKPSTIEHDGQGVFTGLPERLTVGRYHSLAVTDELPDCLIETARTDDGHVVMGVRHRNKPHAGVQFHPESILTDAGYRMIETFCRICLEPNSCTIT